MDIHVHGAAASADERAAVDLLLGAATSGWEGAARDIERDGRSAHGGRAARAQRHLLLPALHAVQDRVGWVSEGALNYICERLTAPPRPTSFAAVSSAMTPAGPSSIARASAR